jgi:hypothetical protein
VDVTHFRPRNNIREDVLKIIPKLALAVFALTSGAAGLAADRSSSVSLFGNVSSTESSGSYDFTDATIYGSYGRLLGEAIEVEIQLGQSIGNSGSGSSRVTSTTVGALARYYFTRVGEVGSATPYLKAGLRVNFDKFGGRTSRGYGAQGGGGLEYSLNGGASTFVEGTYSRLKYSGRFDYTVGLFEVNVGLRLRF